MQSVETQIVCGGSAALRCEAAAANWLAHTLGLCASHECRSHQSRGRGAGGGTEVYHRSWLERRAHKYTKINPPPAKTKKGRTHAEITFWHKLLAKPWRNVIMLFKTHTHTQIKHILLHGSFLLDIRAVSFLNSCSCPIVAESHVGDQL